MKQLISFVLLLILLTSIIGVSAINNETANKITVFSEDMSVSVTSSDNIAAVNKLTGNKSTTFDAKNTTSVLSLNLEMQTPSESTTNLISCKANGSIQIGSSINLFEVNGQLQANILDNNTTIYIGGLAGYINSKEDPSHMLSLTFCYNDQTGEYYIPVCIGSYGLVDSQAALVEFGAPFIGLSEATRKMSISNMDQNVLSSNRVLEPENRVADSQYYFLTNNTGTYNGSPVVFHSLFGSKEAVPSGMWHMTVKCQVNLNKFGESYDALLPPITGNGGTSQVISTINHRVTNAWLNFRTNSTNNRITDVRPEPFSSSIAVRLPTFLIPKLPSYATYLATYFSIQIPVNGVSHAFSDNYSNLQTKIWSNTTAGIKDIVTSATTQDATVVETTGISSDFLVLNGSSLGNYTTVSNSSVEIYFEEATLGGDSLPRYIIISSAPIAYNIKSVR